MKVGVVVVAQWKLYTLKPQSSSLQYMAPVHSLSEFQNLRAVHYMRLRGARPCARTVRLLRPPIRINSWNNKVRLQQLWASSQHFTALYKHARLVQSFKLSPSTSQLFEKMQKGLPLSRWQILKSSSWLTASYRCQSLQLSDLGSKYSSKYRGLDHFKQDLLF